MIGKTNQTAENGQCFNFGYLNEIIKQATWLVRKKTRTAFPSTSGGCWPISQQAEVNRGKSNVDDGQHRWKKSTLHELIIT